MEYDTLKTIMTVSIAGLGWAVTHYFNTKRDRQLKQKEVITGILRRSLRLSGISWLMRGKREPIAKFIRDFKDNSEHLQTKLTRLK